MLTVSFSLVVAGEEHEDVLKQARVKMFQMEDGGWKERGTGTLKVLVEKEHDEENASEEKEDKPPVEVLPKTISLLKPLS